MERSAGAIWEWNFGTSEMAQFNDRDSLESEQSDDSESESDQDILDEADIREKLEEEKRRQKEENYAKFEKEVRTKLFFFKSELVNGRNEITNLN